MALRAAGWAGEAAGSAGIRLALFGAAIALAKVWAFPALAGWGLADRRGVAVWGRPAAPGDDA